MGRIKVEQRKTRKTSSATNVEKMAILRKNVTAILEKCKAQPKEWMNNRLPLLPNKKKKIIFYRIPGWSDSLDK